ncbi:MAG: RHS repeat-associated core domain-containing protein [Muribaculaceae bacterium]|nr:RHS repeat-associated core domain-containing protein [Muribaculaceae bacterium]
MYYLKLIRNGRLQFCFLQINGLGVESKIEHYGPVINLTDTIFMTLFPGGYATINESSATFHYYTQDYLGNNRAVINGSTGFISQNALRKTHYANPYGGVIANLGTAATTGQPYKFSGKELITANGLNEYDFGARQYYSAVPGFRKPDPMAEKYPWLSPYVYCANNPVNVVDPTGKDICVLNYGDDLTHQHLAMLIQNENEKWQYFSVNGNNVYISGEHKGGRTFNDIGVGEWDTPEEFLNSDYNVRNDNCKDNKAVNNFGFEEGFVIETTRDQDKVMIETFSQVADSEYSLLGNNCAIAVQKTMFEADIPVAEPRFTKTFVPANKTLGESSFVISRPNFNVIPSQAFKSIIQQNPLGRYVHK